MIPIYEGIEELIPQDSYANSQDYKDLKDRYTVLRRERDDLKNKINDLPPNFKPKEEWDKMEKFMYDKFRIMPKYPDSDDVKEMKSNLDTLERMLGNIGDRLEDIRQKVSRERRLQRSNIGLPEETSRRDFQGFTTKTTGTSYYDEFLSEDGLEDMRSKKGLTGYISEMSPREYLERCADIFNSTFEAQIYSTDNEFIYKYADMMKHGTKFDMPYLNYDSMNQEGRHRAQAAYVLGIEKIPVLIVTKY